MKKILITGANSFIGTNFRSISKYQNIEEVSLKEHSPDEIDYVIPGNDDSIRAVKLYCESVCAAVLDAKSAGLGLSAKSDDFVEEAAAE